MKKAIALVYGKIDWPIGCRKDFVEGDALWNLQYCDDDEPIELKRWSMDEEEEAEKELAKYKCRYWESSGSFYAEEYGLEYREYDDEWELRERYSCCVAEDEKVAEAKEIAKLIKESGERDPRLLRKFCDLADMGYDWEYACLIEAEIAKGVVDEDDDDETCEEVIRRAENKLEVWLD